MADNKVNPPIRVIELFAGVGGFRVGIERYNRQCGKNIFEVVWGNQWEPTTNLQHAYEVYSARWPGAVHSNEDISKVKVTSIPEFDVMVAGFPCQDYSVAKPKRHSKGIKGKKGALWWKIAKIVRKTKNKNSALAKYAVFENVDRLLKSPAHQPGRDFALLLTSLVKLGYDVEWRVINAADYGFPQKRKRVFIVASQSSAGIAKDRAGLLKSGGVLARAFPIKVAFTESREFPVGKSFAKIFADFKKNKSRLCFMNAGVVVNGKILTARVRPKFRGKRQTLKDVLTIGEVPEDFLIAPGDLVKWRYVKDRKNILKTKSNGISYRYKEGAVTFPDALDKPARTIVTLEGSKRASRMTHVVEYRPGEFRRLMPEELEALNGFPRGHTALPGMTAHRRAFFMGNALVTGLVTAIFKQIARIAAISTSEAEPTMAQSVKAKRTDSNLVGLSDALTSRSAAIVVAPERLLAHAGR